MVVCEMKKFFKKGNKNRNEYDKVNFFIFIQSDEILYNQTNIFKKV